MLCVAFVWSFVAAPLTPCGRRRLQVVGLALAAIGVVGERWSPTPAGGVEARPAHRGTVCDVGLWSWSRHPNYFFEMVVWVGHATFALAYPWGAMALLAPGDLAGDSILRSPASRPPRPRRCARAATPTVAYQATHQRVRAVARQGGGAREPAAAARMPFMIDCWPGASSPRDRLAAWCRPAAARRHPRRVRPAPARRARGRSSARGGAPGGADRRAAPPRRSRSPPPPPTRSTTRSRPRSSSSCSARTASTRALLLARRGDARWPTAEERDARADRARAGSPTAAHPRSRLRLGLAGAVGRGALPGASRSSGGVELADAARVHRGAARARGLTNLHVITGDVSDARS
jgi:hypothetical protein